MPITSKLFKSPNLYLSTSVAKRRLILSLALFFICLTLPLMFLVDRVYQQFQREMFYQYRDSAEQVVIQANDAIEILVAKEESRPFTDYQFYKVSESPLLKQKGIELSPLSRLDGEENLPGIIGYFQVDPDGSFSSPILPSVEESFLTSASLNIEREELTLRLRRRSKIKTLLLNANLLDGGETKPLEEHEQMAPAPKHFAKKTAKIKLADLKLDDSYSKDRSESRLLESIAARSSRIAPLTLKEKEKPE